MKKLFTTATAAVIAVSCAMAKPSISATSFRGGLNINSFDKDDYFETIMPGANLGATFTFSFVDFLGIQSGLFLNTRGATDYESSEGKASIFYMSTQIPLFLEFKQSITDDFRIIANIGPTIGIPMFTVVSNQAGKAEELAKSMAWWFDAGVAFGIAIEFDKYYFGVEYNMGLTNYPSAMVGNTKVRTIAVNFGHTIRR